MVLLLLLLLATLLLDAYVFGRLFVAFRRLTFPEVAEVKERDLPSVSICISARNETHAMTQCLERVVATEYPKLEVIVLDDGSRDDTSTLIKAFAHSGVRFIEGKPLPDGWLGKNYALSVLAKEASGEYVFFMDVDTLIERKTLLQLMSYVVQHSVDMTSVIPIRSDYWQASTLMTTMRYFWTMLAYKSPRPRAAANAWLIKREAVVDAFDTDASLPLAVQLVTSLAQKLTIAGKKVRLLISDKQLGLSYEKRWSSQIETSIRLLYPQSRGHWYIVAGMVALLAVSLIPYAAVFWTPWALVLIAIQFLLAYYYLSQVWVRYRLIGALLLPVTIIQEIVLYVVSWYRYNFGTVTWKGRPITTK